MTEQKITPKSHWIRLADAYQRLGHAEYDNWRNYHVAEMVDGKWELFDLNSLIQPKNHQDSVPQFFRMSIAEAMPHKVTFANEVEAREHRRIRHLLFQKVIGTGNTEVACTDINGKTHTFPEEIWSAEKTADTCSIIESYISADIGLGLQEYYVLVEPARLTEWTEKTLADRKKTEADDKRTGRPESDNKKIVLEVVASIKEQFPSDTNQSRLARRAHIELKKLGINTPDSDGLRVFFR